MDSVTELIAHLQGISGWLLATSLLLGITYAAFKSAASARLVTHRVSGTAERLARIERLLNSLTQNGLIVKETSSDDSPPNAETESERTDQGTPDETDHRFYRSRGYRRIEPPSVAARRLLSTAIEELESELTVDKALQLYTTISDQENRVEERANLRDLSVQQINSAASTKTSMIWLFLAFNLAVIFGLIFSTSAFVNAKEVVLGLYISMAMFIVYVFRASNTRTLTLLSISEDLKRYHDAEKYMSNLRPQSAPSERDVEILKLILTNRAEREKGAEHPYELVLKGITNSTVLLKGGKVAGTSSKSTNTDARNPVA